MLFYLDFDVWRVSRVNARALTLAWVDVDLYGWSVYECFIFKEDILNLILMLSNSILKIFLLFQMIFELIKIYKIFDVI